MYTRSLSYTYIHTHTHTQLKSLKQQQFVAHQLIQAVRESVNHASDHPGAVGNIVGGDAAVREALNAYDRKTASK